MLIRIILILFAAHVAFAGVTYSYDAGGHLVKADYGSAGVVVYTYDGAGNWITRQIQSVTTNGITIQTSPPGLQFSVDNGTAQTAPQTLNLTPGTHTLAVTSTQAGAAGTQYVFASWSDGGAASHTITVSGTPASYTATFVTQYQLSISASPAAGGSVTPSSGGFYNSGSLVPIAANASTGYSFAGWTGAAASATNSSTTTTMSGPQTIVANFSAQSSVSITEYPVPTSEAGLGGITSGPDGAVWFTESGASKIGRITTSGVISEYSLPLSTPIGIVAGPDGALWFTASNNIGRITTAGVITEYPVPTSDAGLGGITSGPDGALWFTEIGGNKIGRISTTHVVTEYAIPTATSFPTSITSGPDGALWFTETLGKNIGRITTAGVITEYPTLFSSNAPPEGITSGPDGALWFVAEGSTKVGRITTTGVVTQYPVPAGQPIPNGITSGPDGALWFTDGTDHIGRITTTGVVTQYPVLTSSSEPDAIVSGPDDALWFVEYGANKIGRLGLASNPTHPTFFTGEVALGSGVYYLQFSDGNLFGYYNYQYFPILYHYDLGFESFIDAGNGAAYLYDFTSGHWWYTSASLFPYLYDFTLNTFIYYFPDTKNLGHYTTNPRYFSNLTTQKIFTM